MNRPLSDCERWYWIANQFSPNNVLSVCHVDAPYDADLLRQAAGLLQMRHPFLNVHIVVDDATPMFVTEGTSPPSVATRSGDLDELLRTAIEDELNVPIVQARGSDRSPLFRCLALTSPGKGEWVAMFNAIHIVSDATSAMLALRDWLDLYGQLLAGVDYDSLRASSKKFIARPGCENLFPAEFRRSAGKLWRVAKSQLMQQYRRFKLRPSRLLPERYAPFEERKNGFVHRYLDQESIASLQKACQMENVTLHGAFVASLALAIYEVLKARGAAKSNVVEIGSPNNIRQYLEPVIGEEMGSYVCTLYSFLKVNASVSFWELARQANRELKRRIGDQDHFSTLALLTYITPRSVTAAAGVMNQVEKQGPGNVCLSNIGVFDMPAVMGSVKAKSAYWTASLSVTGYLVLAVNTSLGQTHFCFAYVKNAISAGDAGKIARSFTDKLILETEKSAARS